MSYPQDQLSSLMIQVQNGDKSAYNDLLQATVPILRSYITRIINRRRGEISSVEDILQETLISIHKARHTYDHARPLLPWLLAIAKFRTADFLRKNKKHLEAEDSEAKLSNTESEHRHDVIVETRDYLVEAFHGLSDRQIEIVKLLKVEDRSIAEVASETGLSESLVKVTLHRALKLLRKKCEDYID